MAKKYALYLPYKVIDSLSSGNVTDSQFREFIMGLAEYDRTGTFPDSVTAGFSMMYELVKSDLDFAKTKYEDIVEKRRQAGKLGGAPMGNKNALGNRGGGAPVGNQNAAKGDYSNQITEEPDFPDEPIGTVFTPEKQTQAKQADNSSKYTVVSNQMTDIRSSSKSEVVFSKQPTTTFLKYIDNKTAQKLCANIDSSWLTGAFTYPEYITEAIEQNQNYADKPQEEKIRLFITLFTVEDRKTMFLQWRQEQETAAVEQEAYRQKEAAEQEHSRKLEALKRVGPQKCGNCGKVIEAPNTIRGECPSCGYYYILNEENETWEFSEPRSLMAEFKKRVRQNNLNNAQSEEIDF